MKKHYLLSLFVVISLTANAQLTNVEVKTGPFEADYTSLDSWECPEWFKDAKFGIWAHWGPQCHAEDGDWYARFMYYEGSGQNEWHYNHFGDPAVFGLKDLCNDWKAQNWNPESLVNLYKSVGARYFMALGNHHDNFDLWNSPYQEWNSVNVGPKKDIIKGWSDACKKAGLPLGVSIHASHAWTWLEPSQDYDGNLTKEDGYKLNEDGTEKWWKGMDPQELYAQRHPHSTGWDDSGTIHSQWDWGNGADLPSGDYKMKFQNRVLELINDYDPDMIYFDDTAMPFYGCDDAIGQNILAHYYNHSAANNDGTPNVVVTGKQLTSDQKKHMLWDVERGIPDRIQDEYWQTCTCIGSWHYDTNTYQNGWYKSAQQVVDMLVDIVSKNGNLLLSIPVKSDGTIDEKEEAILAGIKAWMDINSNSIYGTRTWKTFGEGPLAEAANPISAQGFNEGNNYSSKDVRFVQRNDTVFATIMRWPGGKTFKFESFGMSSEYYNGKVESVELLGYGKVNFTEEVDGVTVDVPETQPNEIAPVYQFTFIEGTEVDVSLADIISAYEALASEMMEKASYNTGKFSKKNVVDFQQTLNDAKQYIGSSAYNQRVIINQINEAYKTLKSGGSNQAGAPNEADARDLTIDVLGEANNFTATTMGSRFGTPYYWTVENFYVPVSDSSKGIKNGIDAYPGYNTLSIGVWSGEDVEPYTCDVTNARIYKKVHLDAGRYYFGPRFETNYNISDNAYIFAANEVLSTENVEEQSIAFAHIKEAGTGQFYGIYFTIPEDQDVVLGFQANITDGSSQQEFRVSDVKLLYYGNMDFDALGFLILTADQIMSDAKVNSNTGYYKQEAVDKLNAAIEAAMLIDDGASYDEFMEAYNTLTEAVNDFQTNGKNVGGAPIESGCEDITVEIFSEADNFARTPETDDGDRFGATKYWTIENFGFGDQAGIDHNPGYDCLHLEVWWNNNAYTENGYDISNVRLYQLADLPAGRYFFGASYPTYEPNEDAYIFTSKSLLDTKDISTQSIAYEKVNLAPQDGTVRGIYFTLEEDGPVYLGFQADFSNVVTNNIRVRGVKLLYYGEITYEKVMDLIDTIEEDCKNIKINDNTGFYSQKAYDELLAAISSAKNVSPSADYETIDMAYTTLNDTYNNFLVNGKNAGGQPTMLDANDITIETLSEAHDFARADASVSTRFATPKYWTVENFQIPNGGDGTKNGLDKYPGYDCLMLGLWDDRGRNEEGDLANARIYQKVHLDAGRYYFGNTFNTLYNLNQAYIFASEELIPTSEMEENSIAYYSLKNGASDKQYYGIFFTLDEAKDIYLGFQADLANGAGEQEFRADNIVLYSYGVDTAIENISDDEATDAPVQIYSLQGMRLNSAPAKGFYIIRQGNKAYKYYRK